MRTEIASRYFLYLTLINMVIAVGATAPVLDPHLGLPIKVNHWPGTWMFIAYFSFLVAGVLGMLAWSVIYYLLPKLLQKTSVYRTLLLFQIIGFEVSVVGVTVLMGFFAGYVGGSLVQAGLGDFIVTRVIEWTVIPIGVFIGVALVCVLTGMANIILSRG